MHATMEEMDDEVAEEYLTVNEARELLGVSQSKLWRLLKDGTLLWVPDPLDKRAKLIKRTDLEALLSKTRRKTAKQPPKEPQP
jgi:excisionase family DNA binding protein